ncbi:MAG: extracellular solute-binding protein [Magnetococcales bacterium]|nr:extracellular solute-binding protein [Magnetococcales bacterium]
MKRSKAWGVLGVAVGAALGWMVAVPAWAEDELVVYTARKEHMIKPLFDAYTAKTGVKIQFLSDNAEPLLMKLQTEGSSTPADLLMTVDAGNLWRAAKEGVLAPIESAVLEKNVAPHLRDPGKQWFALSQRARVMVYATDRVKPEPLKDYADLADPKWKGKLCLRSSKKIYNQSLVALLIDQHGEAKTETMVQGWVTNLAEPPAADDTKVMEAIAAGQCDVGVVNTYYYGLLMDKKPNLKLALHFPPNGGTHLNISGAGVTKHAPHPAEAIKLLEWLTTPEAQRMFADLNFEYPVNPAAPMNDKVKSWGTPSGDQRNMSLAGELQEKAVKLMDRAGYK